MTTVVNNPAPSENSGGYGFLIGAIILIAFVAIGLFYGIPAIQKMGPIQLQIQVPQINLPTKVDVNVKQGK